MQRIQALDRRDNYGCELIDKEPPDMWAQFVRLGEHYGISEAELSSLSTSAHRRRNSNARLTVPINPQEQINRQGHQG
jgi:hypothetical protein